MTFILFPVSRARYEFRVFSFPCPKKLRTIYKIQRPSARGNNRFDIQRVRTRRRSWNLCGTMCTHLWMKYDFVNINVRAITVNLSAVRRLCFWFARVKSRREHVIFIISTHVYVYTYTAHGVTRAVVLFSRTTWRRSPWIVRTDVTFPGDLFSFACPSTVVRTIRTRSTRSRVPRPVR